MQQIKVAKVENRYTLFLMSEFPVDQAPENGNIYVESYQEIKPKSRLKNYLKYHITTFEGVVIEDKFEFKINALLTKDNLKDYRLEILWLISQTGHIKNLFRNEGFGYLPMQAIYAVLNALLDIDIKSIFNLFLMNAHWYKALSNKPQIQSLIQFCFPFVSQIKTKAYQETPLKLLYEEYTDYHKAYNSQHASFKAIVDDCKADIKKKKVPLQRELVLMAPGTIYVDIEYKETYGSKKFYNIHYFGRTLGGALVSLETKEYNEHYSYTVGLATAKSVAYKSGAFVGSGMHWSYQEKDYMVCQWERGKIYCADVHNSKVASTLQWLGAYDSSIYYIMTVNSKIYADTFINIRKTEVNTELLQELKNFISIQNTKLCIAEDFPLDVQQKWLFQAVFMGNINKVKERLKIYTNIKHTQIYLCAVQRGHLEIMKCIESGADEKKQDLRTDKKIYLDIAIEKGWLDITQHVLARYFSNQPAEVQKASEYALKCKKPELVCYFLNETVATLNENHYRSCNLDMQDFLKKMNSYKIEEITCGLDAISLNDKSYTPQKIIHSTQQREKNKSKNEDFDMLVSKNPQYERL